MRVFKACKLSFPSSSLWRDYSGDFRKLSSHDQLCRFTLAATQWPPWWFHQMACCSAAPSQLRNDVPVPFAFVMNFWAFSKASHEYLNSLHDLTYFSRAVPPTVMSLKTVSCSKTQTKLSSLLHLLSSQINFSVEFTSTRSKREWNGKARRHIGARSRFSRLGVGLLM